MYEYTRVLCIVNVNNIYCDDENVAFVCFIVFEKSLKLILCCQIKLICVTCTRNQNIIHI